MGRHLRAEAMGAQTLSDMCEWAAYEVSSHLPGPQRLHADLVGIIGVTFSRIIRRYPLYVPPQMALE